jgi:hypothetical protein
MRIENTHIVHTHNTHAHTGGYNLDNLGSCVVGSMEGLVESHDHNLRTVRALNGQDVALQPEPMQKIEDVVSHVKKLHTLHI